MFKPFKKKKQRYQPPEMPPFPVDYEGVMRTIAPYYQQGRPLDFLFEMYVMDVLEELPEETKSALEDFSSKHPSLFEKHNGDWRKHVVKESHLSETIEVAIWDLWIRNSATAKRDGWYAHPWHYAQLFMENYFADGSQVDVWEGNSLAAAKQRIDEYKSKC